ncbi:hypothetical protein GS597_03730 [Synechococcales cyanobacterium C]|uniref:Uncharacterized protein n=1 Tax=Petrachloros mirabilis ULC683 TaxID=2781853 RepID=A0A8K1ZXT8_9CYAN|nr:hypothetical protein [Petrachloros mirabilis]NCJ05632.1 hypothetical protein [Petrachloros mirabilis ULC683]
MSVVMFLVAFVLSLWLTQVILLTPIDLAHWINIPRSLLLVAMVGVFAWLFGD